MTLGMMTFSITTIITMTFSIIAFNIEIFGAEENLLCQDGTSRLRLMILSLITCSITTISIMMLRKQHSTYRYLIMKKTYCVKIAPRDSG